MLLKELKMRNFRQYKGVQDIVFSTDPDKNVTVILGNNTFGKTTLLQAFNWCFYQKVLLDNPDMLLNLDIAAQLTNGESETVEVEIVLIHSSREYTITTTQQYIKSGTTVSGERPRTRVCYSRDDGQSEPVKESQIERVIQSILPEGLSNFFFFDTERVASVSTRDDLTDSVKNLLGLSVLDDALVHIGDRTHKKSVIGQFHNEMNLDGDQKAQQAIKDIQDNQDERERNTARQKECDSQIDQFEGRKKQLDDILRNNEDAKELQRRKEALEDEVKRDSESLISTTEVLRRDFGKSSFEYFIQPLLDQAEETLQDAEIDDKGIRDLTKPTLDEILARGVCVCGLKFNEHPEAVCHIEEEMLYCPPESIGNSVRNYRERIAAYSKNQDATLLGVRNRRAATISAKDRIQNNDDEIDSLSVKIGQKEDLSSYENERNHVKTELKKLYARRDDLLREDGRLKSEIEKHQRTYNSLTAVSKKNRQYMRYIAYAEEIQQWLKSTYSEKELEVREALEERVNSMFEQMYHGTRRVIIDAKYHVDLLTTIANREQLSGESEGLNRVKNFAFIAGLVSLAKERIVSNTGESEFDLSSEPYPLVMDAPFSNTDETHIANISKVLPEASEQVIMFVMQKDWCYALPVLEKKVGARYELEKISEQYSKLGGINV